MSDFEELMTYLTAPINPDPDSDGIGDRDDLDAGTDPKDPGSRLEITSAAPGAVSISIQRQVSTGKTYRVIRSSEM